MKNGRWWSSQGRNRTPARTPWYHDPSRRDKQCPRSRPRAPRGRRTRGFRTLVFHPVMPGLIGHPGFVFYVGFRPHTTRSFCFGKRTQNHWRPGVALRVPLPQSRLLGLRNSLRSNSPRLGIEFSGPPRSHARRRRDEALSSKWSFRGVTRNRHFSFCQSSSIKNVEDDREDHRS